MKFSIIIFEEKDVSTKVEIKKNKTLSQLNLIK